MVNAHGDLANQVVTRMARAAQDYSQLSALRRPYKVLMQRALLEYVRQGDVAYFGYCGHLLLPGIAHAARVRILAPIQLRIELLMQQGDVMEEQARERIHQVDVSRTALEKSLLCSFVSSLKNSKFSRSIRMLIVFVMSLSPVSVWRLAELRGRAEGLWLG